MEYRLNVVGIGPGSKGYVLPEALKAIENAKVLVGGKRALDGFAKDNQRCITIGANLKIVIDEIKSELLHTDVVVMVSGDPGFHSMLVRLKKEFNDEQIKVVPGISSLQLAFARLNLPWQEASLLSMHGKEQPKEKILYEKNKKLGLLTDSINTPAVIAEKLLDAGWPHESKGYVCANLSYPDEKIETFTLEDMLKAGSYNNCVVVVTD